MPRALIHLILAGVLLAAAGRAAAGEPAGGGTPRAPSIVLVGDVLLAGRAETLIQQDGALAPFSQVSHVLNQADLAIVNLECSLARGGKPADKQFTFRALPESAAALAAAGFDLVTLANNHSVDYGADALLETMVALRKHGLRHVGAGRNLREAGRPAVFECGSPPVRIAVVAFSNMLPKSFYAASDRPGTNPAWSSRVAQSVRQARGEADVVIALFHWGQERSSSPSLVQRHLARTAAAAGADLVVGHHPHVLQGVEVKDNALIAYSLGNFLFPSRDERRRTAILRYTPGASGHARAEIVPCVLDGFRPRLAADEERSDILAHIAGLSRHLGCDAIDNRGRIALPERSAPVDKLNPTP